MFSQPPRKATTLNLFNRLKDREKISVMAKHKLISDTTINRINYKFQYERNSQACLDHCEILKVAALQGSQLAIDHLARISRDVYLTQHLEPSISYLKVTQNLAPFIACLKEIGLTRNEPKLLFCAYQNLLAERNYYEQFNASEIHEAINCLELAAHMQGEEATFCSIALAYLYSAELGYDYSWTSTPFKPLSKLYRAERYSALSESNSEELLAEVIAYAELGCRAAIEKLIAYYDVANSQADEIQKLRWQEKLENLLTFLKDQFDKYYELVIHNTIQFGYTYINANKLPIDIAYFIHVHAGLKQKDKAILFNSFRKKLVKAANTKNIHACHLLGGLYLYGLKDFYYVDLIQAKEWFQKALTFKPSPCSRLNEIYSSLYEISKLEHESIDAKKQLLQQAVAKGSADSAVELGILELNASNFDAAKVSFDLALSLSQREAIGDKICVALLSVLDKPLYTIEILEPYYLQVCATAIKQGFLKKLQIMLNATKDIHQEKLYANWLRVSQILDESRTISFKLLDELTNETTIVLKNNRNEQTHITTITTPSSIQTPSNLFQPATSQTEHADTRSSNVHSIRFNHSGED